MPDTEIATYASLKGLFYIHSERQPAVRERCGSCQPVRVRPRAFDLRRKQLMKAASTRSSAVYEHDLGNELTCSSWIDLGAMACIINVWCEK